MNATARKKGKMKRSLAVRRSIGIQWEETHWACAIRKKPSVARRSSRDREHAAAMVALISWRRNAPAQTLINVDFGVGTQSAKVGPAATRQATNDFWNLYRFLSAMRREYGEMRVVMRCSTAASSRRTGPT